jgi:hypothetical protein
MPISRAATPLPLHTSRELRPGVEVAFAEAPLGRAGRRAKARRSRRAACSREGRRWLCASRRRSLPPSAGRRDRSAPCCAADVRRGSRAWLRASDTDRRHRALGDGHGTPANRTAGHGARWPYQALARPRSRHKPRIVLSLRRGDAEADWASTRHSALVRSDRLAGRLGTSASLRERARTPVRRSLTGTGAVDGPPRPWHLRPHGGALPGRGADRMNRLAGCPSRLAAEPVVRLAPTYRAARRFGRRRRSCRLPCPWQASAPSPRRWPTPW